MPPKISDKQILDNYYTIDEVGYDKKVVRRYECKHCHSFFTNMHSTNARAHLSNLVYAKKHTIMLCQLVPKEVAEVNEKFFNDKEIFKQRDSQVNKMIADSGDLFVA
jgi:hypothetical protein